MTAILVVDDSMISRRATLAQLPGDWAARAVQAANGREALEQLRSRRFAAVVLDLNMPEMDGYALLAALQQEQIEAFVVVLSADVQPRAMARVITLGAAAFLPKPVQGEALRAVLADAGVA